MLCAGLVGLAAGPLLPGRPARRPGPSSRTEVRVLVALVVAASAVGPIVAAISHAPIGPLSVLQFVVLSPLPDAAAVQQICAATTIAAADDCRALQAQLRLSGLGPALASTIPVLLLLVVAEGLRRGRRAALVVGIVLNLVLAALGVLLAVLVASTPEQQLMVFDGRAGRAPVPGARAAPAAPARRRRAAVVRPRPVRGARARRHVPAPARHGRCGAPGRQRDLRARRRPGRRSVRPAAHRRMAGARPAAALPAARLPRRGRAAVPPAGLPRDAAVRLDGCGVLAGGGGRAARDLPPAACRSGRPRRRQGA